MASAAGSPGELTNEFILPSPPLGLWAVAFQVGVCVVQVQVRTAVSLLRHCSTAASFIPGGTVLQTVPNEVFY